MPSPRILKKKQETVSEIQGKLEGAKSFILADYRGLTVEQDTELRKAIREAGLNYKVIKNTLTSIAVNNIGLGDLDPFLKGPTAIAYSDDDEILTAKVMSKFASKFDKLEIKAGVVEGRLMDVAQVKALAEIPSKEELIARALGGFNAPISGFANVLGATIRGLVVALNAIAEKQG